MSALTRPAPALVGCRIVVAEVPRPVRPESVDAETLLRALAAIGSEVVRLTPLREDHPIPAGTKRTAYRIASGQVDAVLFPAAEGVPGWLSTVERLEMLDAVRDRALASRLLLATADATATARLAESGLPASTACGPTAGGLAETVAAHFIHTAPERRTDVGRVAVRSGGVLIDGAFLPLSRGAVSLVEALFVADGRVLSRAEIGHVLPGGRRSPRAVEVAVARLRESLGDLDLVQTVVKRGYRLAVTDERAG
ncbi:MULTISPECIES: winged helix-turn-helix domain-containing protein [Microbacterium]|uniref:winged helix-turn-helix domain-containing protein n=1 Tax=Microbacterium TaxID=33882 RepID=UPI0011EAC2FC|nr:MULTISPECIES: winged helix-turn-helix domain-containing protein [Microbacterium]